MIILLHGFTGSPRSFDALRGRITGPVSVPEIIGHGAPAPGVESFEDEVDRLAVSIAAARGGRPLVVVGYSLGARLALGLAARHPGALDAVVSIGGHPGISDVSARAVRSRSDESLSERIESEGVRDFVDEWEALPLFASQRALPPSVLARQRAIRLAHDAHGLSRSLAVAGLGRMPDLRPMLEETRVRIHMVTGVLDEKFTTLATELRPTGHTVVVGAGHNVLLERPDAVAAIIGGLPLRCHHQPREVRP